jgi:hypothetical protein
MRIVAPLALLPLLYLAACGDVGGSAPTPTPGPGDASSQSDPDTGTPPLVDGGPQANDAGVFVTGNPDGKCSKPLPASAARADVSKPTSVVGSGTAASCTFAALSAAVSAGGVVVLDCGPAPVTIPITSTLTPPTNKNTVIDGAGKVTLDGRGTTQILNWNSANFRANDMGLTLQGLAFINGKIAGSKPIPAAPAPCSQGFNEGEGGAIFMRDGNLTVIDSYFENNVAAPEGPDVGGGAIRMLGSKRGLTIVRSTFKNNHASNGGAVGCLFAKLEVYDSLFLGNSATGHDANNDDATKCSVINNGQHEIGSGGNGGALYSDGAGLDVSLCGDKVTADAAGTKAFGGGLFFTSNDFGGTLTIADTTMTGNTGGYWTSVKEGTQNNAGTAVGTNTKSLTITGSTLQGLP